MRYVGGMIVGLLVLTRATLLRIPRTSDLIQVLFLAHIAFCYGWLLQFRDSVIYGLRVFHCSLCIWLIRKTERKKIAGIGPALDIIFTYVPLSRTQSVTLPKCRRAWEIECVCEIKRREWDVNTQH